MVRPEAAFLAPVPVRVLAAFFVGLVTHPANWARHLFVEVKGPGLSPAYQGHELERAETPTTTLATTTVTSTTPAPPACLEPAPPRLVGEGASATVEVPVLVTFVVAVSFEAVCAVCCCTRLRLQAADRRSRKPLGAARLQVQ